MTRWSPESGVVRAADATTVQAARFDVPLTRGPQLPAEIAERLRKEAQAAGFAAGWAEGRRAAEVGAREARARFDVEARAALAAQEEVVARVLGTVMAAVERFEQRALPAVEGMEADLVAAAFALAEAIIARELATADDPGRDALRRALAFAPPGRAAIVRMSPADAGTLPGTFSADGRDLVILSDPALDPGDAVVECDATTIESRVGDGLARARAALFGDGENA
jgi:flagellar assembly protein FliH